MTADREPIDPALDAMLRETAAETPPAHVDAAILAAAHRAVASAPRRPSRRHWRVWLPLGAAATLAAVVIGLHPVERQAPEAPAAVTVPARPASSPVPAAAGRDEAAAKTAAPSARNEMPASAFDAPRAASAQRASEAGVESKQALQDARVAQAIERIRALRRDGREAEATAALAQLRETVTDADARLPPDLRDWASTARR